MKVMPRDLISRFPAQPVLALMGVAVTMAILAGGGGACAKDTGAPTPDAMTNTPTGSGGTGNGGAGGNSGGATGGPGADGSAPGADASTPTTCAGLRNCITACDTDPACKQGCSARATTTAKTDHLAVQTCSQQGCDQDDVLCRCSRECIAGGACDDIVTTCRGFEEDPFCDEICH